jgi:uncharacterized protein (TIGR02246 family)
MRLVWLATLVCSFTRLAHAQQASEQKVREAVHAFYGAFNMHDFGRAAEFTTADWVHINPFGGWTRGRDNVLAELREVHGSFLRDVKDIPDTTVVRLTGATSAVVTVPSRLSTYVTPDGRRHERERQIRTFVFIRLEDRWRIVQDQNTIISRG